MFGPLEIILVIVVIALIFGAKKLPELGRGLGQGIKEFKKETHADKPVTDVASRQLDPVTGAPISTQAHVSETAGDRR
ncbi:twin-arginine translocase TatA/TatE family subunit [Deinococcus taeanensis]|uniref:twin-arginine translocase TatA/TatE family subunit n=1 Tax=Deinococcus taeanensis TaxID=2737050 RepID=UPI001CDD484E|nr:twin-arginine translocase TatA/TatE family subunit [Deinococcus taeanensis]UBV41965.1 twin-arginine translocase TatA/TatE family subunit [Deinococcus taeanensis]